MVTVKDDEGKNKKWSAGTYLSAVLRFGLTAIVVLEGKTKCDDVP